MSVERDTGEQTTRRELLGKSLAAAAGGLLASIGTDARRILADGARETIPPLAPSLTQEHLQTVLEKAGGLNAVKERVRNDPSALSETILDRGEKEPELMARLNPYFTPNARKGAHYGLQRITHIRMTAGRASTLDTKVEVHIAFWWVEEGKPGSGAEIVMVGTGNEAPRFVPSGHVLTAAQQDAVMRTLRTMLR